MRAYNSGFVDYNPQGLVLEIASGLNPTFEADVLLEADRSFIEPLTKRGYAALYGDALNLPFKDKSFDYISCLHLAEHFEKHELVQFFSELQRVASRGYLEVPSIYWELMANCDAPLVGEGTIDGHHKQLCFLHDGVLHMIRKSDEKNPEHQLLRALFFNAINADATAENIEIMMIGFQWEGEIKVEFHESLAAVPEYLSRAMVYRLKKYGESKKSKTPLARMIHGYLKALKDKKRKREKSDKQRLKGRKQFNIEDLCR